jgi:hypothetical protein
MALTIKTRSAGRFATILSGVALALLLAVLVLDLASLLHAAHAILFYPYNIDYGEGIVWQQMLNMIAGRGYAPIGVFPAIVYHYPPVYHLTVALLSAITGADALLVGRALSLTSTLASSILIGAITYGIIRPSSDRRTTMVAAIFAALLFPAFEPVSDWALAMRVDMLAGLLTLGGLQLALMALRRPALIHAAALCFVLGVYTKQVTVAAPAATILGLLLTRPALGWRCLATSAGLGLTALAALTIHTDGGFLRHIILYNINRNEAERLWLLIEPVRSHAMFLVLAGFGAIASARALPDLPRADERRATLLILLLYLGAKTLMLGMIVKSGGSSNYMIEWFGAVAIFAAIGVTPAINTVLGACGGPRTSLLAIPLVASLCFAASADEAFRFGQWTDFAGSGTVRAHKLHRLVEAIRNSAAPVISDDMTLIIRAGKPVLWEPSIAAELASVGRYNEAGFAKMVRYRCFAGFVTNGDRGDWLFDSRYNPAVADAMDQSYPRRFVYEQLTLHLPPHGASPRRCSVSS